MCGYWRPCSAAKQYMKADSRVSADDHPSLRETAISSHPVTNPSRDSEGAVLSRRPHRSLAPCRVGQVRGARNRYRGSDRGVWRLAAAHAIEKILHVGDRAV